MNWRAFIGQHRVVVAIVTVALLLLGVYGLLWRIGYGPPGPEKDHRSFIDLRMAAIRTGMNKSTVVGILGDPADVSKTPNNAMSETITYDGVLDRYDLVFDQGKLIQIFKDRDL